MRKSILAFVAATVFLSSPAHAKSQCGKASWYEFTTRTASGEMADPEAMTAAHRTLKFGTKLKVTNLANGRSTVVRINDRGPFIKGRIIDVTRAVARTLGFKNAGIGKVCIEKL